MTKASSVMTKTVLYIPGARPMWIAGLALLALLLTALAACGDDPTATPVAPTATPEVQQELGTIVDIAVGDGRFETLVAALQAADLVETLQGAGPFTVFAPTDDAFAKLPAGTVEALMADIPALTEILLYHVVPGNVKAAAVVTLDSADTVQGGSVAISVEGNTVRINDATVLITDIEASNGVIHVIDSVLLPPQPAPTPTPAPTATLEPQPMTIVDIAVGDGRFGTLVAALQAADLVETLQGAGPFTVFAPTDDAFAKLPAGTVEALLADVPALNDVLLYHVVPGNVKAADVVALDSADTVQGGSVSINVDGDAVMVNDARVLIPDIEASNGVIHVIDSVLLPPQPAPTPTPVPTATLEPQPMTIVDIAVGDGRFGTLVAALQAADLVETLNGTGPFTVFAPTDDAFAKLPAGTVEALLGDITALTDILLYHVVPGNVVAADVVTLESADTVQGAAVSINVDGDTVMVNEAQVVIVDIKASNGIIHVIDTVLVPPEDLGTIADIATGDGRFGTLVAALQAAGLVDTLQGAGPFTVFAPTDDAFAKLPAGTVEALLADITALSDILLYHVVPGRVLSSDVVALDSADTVQGGSIAITVEKNTVRINDAIVLITDIEASNGVIHVIDSVLIPANQ